MLFSFLYSWRILSHTLMIYISIVGWVEPKMKPNIVSKEERFMLGFVPQPNLQYKLSVCALVFGEINLDFKFPYAGQQLPAELAEKLHP